MTSYVKLLISISIVFLLAANAMAEENYKGTTLLRLSVQRVKPANSVNSFAAIKDVNGDPLYNTTEFSLHSGPSIGAELAASYFIMNNLALELSVSPAKWSYRDQHSNSWAFRATPVSILAQCHPLSFRVVNPYFGYGFSYLFASTKLKKPIGPLGSYYLDPASGIASAQYTGSKVTNIPGSVLQLGVNIADRNESFGINIDFKQYWFTPLATVSMVPYGETSPNYTTSSKIKANPRVISFGITSRF